MLKKEKESILKMLKVVMFRLPPLSVTMQVLHISHRVSNERSNN